jgi:hypothetical protein
MEVQNLLNQVVQELEEHQESLRIKKLIFYARQGYWENDFSVVNSLSLTDSIQQLLISYPTIKDLYNFMYQVIENVSRRDLYAEVANLFLNKISTIYNQSSNNQNDQYTDQQIPNNLVIQVANSLECQQERERIKKLIFAACNNANWENNINVVETYDFKDLVLYLRQINPSLEKLRACIYQVVNTLNRKKIYLFIADIILSKFGILYQDEDSEMFTTTHPSPVSANANTETKQAQNTGSNTDYLNPGLSQPYQLFNIYDAFNLREEFMRYTNPLRSKILLFYTIYKMEVTEQHWSIVRNCTLDELIFRLLRSYQNIKDLELEMYYKARALPEPDENIKTAQAILKIIDNFYDKQ